MMADKQSRRTILKMLGYSVVGSGVAALGVYRYSSRIETGWLEIERVTIPVRNLGSSFEGFKIVLLSDFHLYPYTEIELIKRAVDVANSLKPDLITLGGDYVLTRGDSIFQLAPVLAQLNAKHGVFSVLGNHDYWVNEKIVCRGLEESGLPVLRNSGLTISKEDRACHQKNITRKGWSISPRINLNLRSMSYARPLKQTLNSEKPYML